MRMKPFLVGAALLGGGVFAESILAQPFTMRVVDETGRGVAHVRVVSDNGIVCYSLLDGTLRWSESSITLGRRSEGIELRTCGGVDENHCAAARGASSGSSGSVARFTNARRSAFVISVGVGEIRGELARQP